MDARLPLVGEEPSTATMKFAFDGSNDDPSYRMDSKTVACQSPKGAVFYLYFLQPVTGCYRAYCAIPNVQAVLGPKRNQVPKLDLMI